MKRYPRRVICVAFARALCNKFQVYLEGKKKMMMTTTTRTALALTTAALFAGGTQAATFTTINPPDVGQKSHEEILEEIYGGDFIQNGNDFSNGVVSITRVDDDLDQTYDIGGWSARALARWAAATQAFGTTAGGPLFSVTGGNGDPIGGSISSQPGGSDIAFSRFGTDSNTTNVSTDPDLNPADRDHIVTYQVTILQPQQPASRVALPPLFDATLLLFVEDSAVGSPNEDFDFNDLVIELTTSPVPEPSSIALMAMGVLAMAKRRRRD